MNREKFVFFLLNKLFQNNLLNIFHVLKVKTVVLYMIALGSKCKWGRGTVKGGGSCIFSMVCYRVIIFSFC